MIYTLCYVSKAAEGLSDLAIDTIFLSTQSNNARLNISGILLFGMGNFFQVLEGQKETIETLYEQQIKLDPRHTDIYEIIRRPTEQTIFETYSSLFTIVKTNKQLDTIRTYLNANRIDPTSEKLERLLKPILLDL